MLLDFSSLLIAIGFATAALMLTLFVSWLGARSERYLLSWAIGLALILPSIPAYAIPTDDYLPAVQFTAFALLLSGLTVVYIGARQFRTGSADAASIFFLWAISVATTGLFFAIGLAGIGTAVGNFGGAFWFALAGRQYWLGRGELQLPLTIMALLYGACAVSFALCGIVLLMDGHFVLTAIPSNWAEDLNALVLITSLAGMGALALAVSQMRTAEMHRRQAMTDPLTGFLNRRAVFDLLGDGALERGTAVVMFDLDNFKEINDRFGHAVGDDILQRFATVVSANMRPADRAARLGGEEFCLLLTEVSTTEACGVAERIRADLERTSALSDQHGPPTVSAGVAVAHHGDDSFDALLRKADEALYLAKHDGRNRVQGPAPRLVA